MILPLLALLAQAPVAGQATPPANASTPTPPTSRWPTKEADFTIRDFAFRSGEKLPALRIHYTTLGTPHRDAKGSIDNAVMVLHGAGGTGKQFLSPQFATGSTAPASRSTSAAITSSCPTTSATARRRSHPTGSAPNYRATPTTTWSPRSMRC